MASSEVVSQCEEMLCDTELLPKLKARSKTLSGGMKRKLSVCIALIGNSKVNILFEVLRKKVMRQLLTLKWWQSMSDWHWVQND